MRVQVLATTMNQPKGDYSLLDKMNIQSDAIICNQCDRNEFEEFEYNGYNIKWLSFAERGVGLNRNNGLMRATADIILFADDDVTYLDGYAEIIKKYYKMNPKADVVIFNVDVKRKGEYQLIVKREGKASMKDLTKYGTFCISAKREMIHFNNIYFHLQFGGGTKYSCGEDTLFLQDCYKNKLDIYITKSLIATLEHNESMWFRGYTDKYFYDKGVLYYKINKRLAVLFALYHCIKHKNLYESYGFKKAFYRMKKGIMERKYRA